MSYVLFNSSCICARPSVNAQQKQHSWRRLELENPLPCAETLVWTGMFAWPAADTGDDNTTLLRAVEHACSCESTARLRCQDAGGGTEQGRGHFGCLPKHKDVSCQSRNGARNLKGISRTQGMLQRSLKLLIRSALRAGARHVLGTSRNPLPDPPAAVVRSVVCHELPFG